jgi:hypothetical protein
MACKRNPGPRHALLFSALIVAARGREFLRGSLRVSRPFGAKGASYIVPAMRARKQRVRPTWCPGFRLPQGKSARSVIVSGKGWRGPSPGLKVSGVAPEVRRLHVLHVAASGSGAPAA